MWKTCELLTDRVAAIALEPFALAGTFHPEFHAGGAFRVAVFSQVGVLGSHLVAALAVGSGEVALLVTSGHRL